MKRELRPIEEVEKKLKELETKYYTMYEFLNTYCYKGSDSKQKIEKELHSVNREMEALRWVIKDDLSLPF